MCPGLHGHRRLRHIPVHRLSPLRGDPGLPGCADRGHVGRAAAVPQPPLPVHGGHEVGGHMSLLLFPLAPGAHTFGKSQMGTNLVALCSVTFVKQPFRERFRFKHIDPLTS